MLTTRRGKQFNSIIIKSKDHLQGGRDRDDLFMNPGDIANLGLSDGAQVKVHNEHGEWRARLRSMPIKPGVVQAYWPVRLHNAGLDRHRAQSCAPLTVLVVDLHLGAVTQSEVGDIAGIHEEVVTVTTALEVVLGLDDDGVELLASAGREHPLTLRGP